MSLHPVKLPPARFVALASLQQALCRGIDVQAALDGQLRALSLHPRDTALATELTYGYLRHKGRIDYLLRTFLAKPGKLPLQCVLAFGVAAYERLFLDRVPEYATRSWLTNYVRQTWGVGLTRLASAFITNLTGRLSDLHNVDFYRQDACSLSEFWSRYYSLPLWIVALWMSAYGEERTEKLAKAQLLPAFLGLRINPLHFAAHELVQIATNDQIIRGTNIWGLACERADAKVLFPQLGQFLQQGRLSRQSLASQDVLDSLQLAAARGPIWDVCAGRGGKTCYLLERSDAPVRASDASWPRLQGLRQDLRRLHLRDIAVVHARADHPLPWREKPGCVVIDAPCSGLGVLSRRPDAKWKRSPKDLALLETLQRKMLLAAAASLPKAGRIAYITCTLNPAENERQIEFLLREHPGLRCLELYRGEKGMDLREFFWAALLEKK